MSPEITRRQWLRGGAALALLAALPMVPRRAGAAELRPYETLEFEWVDGTRARPVPARLYLPQGEVPAPLVVFSHGIGGSRRGYSWLGQHLAAHGVASLHPQHVGSDRQIWFGNVFQIAGRLQDAAQEREAIARALDLRFVLDTLLAGPQGGRIDGRRIVAAGHSYGANTTLLAAGARVEREGRAVALAEPRLSAAIVLSAPPFYGDGDARPILGGIGLPTLHVTCTDDTIRIPGYYSGLADRLAVFDATGSQQPGARKWLAVYEGGSHSIFTDRGGSGGAVLNPQVKAATQQLVLAFLQRVWGGDGSALAAWPQQHAGLLARFNAVGA